MKELSIVVLLVVLCSGVVDAQKKVFDHHAYIMSPRMIKLFKDVNIPFSKPDADYSDWNSITKRLGTNKLKLISTRGLYAGSG